MEKLISKLNIEQHIKRFIIALKIILLGFPMILDDFLYRKKSGMYDNLQLLEDRDSLVGNTYTILCSYGENYYHLKIRILSFWREPR